MTYGAGVVMWVLTRRMSGEYFEELVEIEIKSALQNSGKTCNRILQDGDPSKNSRRACDAMDRQNIKLFTIPPRSPDINPIKNLFNQLRRTIKYDSLTKQLHQSKEEFMITS